MFIKESKYIESSRVKVDHYKIEGDTIMHTAEYLNLYRNNELYGGLKEPRKSIFINPQ